MTIVRSKDGTAIAFDRIGHGSPLILVDGALCYQGMGQSAQLAEILAHDFTVFTYDRRGCEKSADTAPYAVEREIEDLAAVLNEADGAAFVWGTSSGAALALEAANRLNGIRKLAFVRGAIYRRRQPSHNGGRLGQNRRSSGGGSAKRCGEALPEVGRSSRPLHSAYAMDADVVEAESHCAHAPLRRHDRAEQPERQAPVGQPVGVSRSTDACYGRWKESCVDAPREPDTCQRIAECTVPHARGSDAHAEAEGARGGFGGVFQGEAIVQIRHVSSYW
jgi:pimeloyl-ACP methyl ester carboxylesterase